MIITKIRLQEETPMTLGNASWPLDPVDLQLNPLAGQNGYLIKNSVGLGPTEITAVVVGFDSNGVPIKDAEIQDREIVLRIGLTSSRGLSVSYLRDELYKFQSKAVVVSFMDESITIAQTKGFIRNFETLHFSKEPEVQLTIECEDGYLYGPEAIDIPVDGFLNSEHPIINYTPGTAPTGFEMTFLIGTEFSDFTISNHAKAWHSGSGEVSNVFTITYEFQEDDMFVLSTRPEDRRATLKRGETYYDLAGFVNSGAVWPKLYPGVNTFDWTFSEFQATISKATYIPRYWGV